MKTKITTEVDLTPEQLAEQFINWGSDEQGKFINLIGEAFRKCDFNAELQCAYMVDDINKNGKDFIFTLANFLKCRGVPSISPKWGNLINHYGGDSLNFKEQP